MNLQQQLMQQMFADHWGYFSFIFFGVFLVKLGVCTTNMAT